MKDYYVFGLCAVVLAWGVGVAMPLAQAQDGVLSYSPPLRGAPAARVGGGARGAEGDNLALCIMAPDHVGLTASPQPTLYWFLTEDTENATQLTITPSSGGEPLLDTRLSGPFKAGAQTLKLRDLDISLVPNRDYRLVVSLLEEGAVSPLVVNGWIRHQPLSNELSVAMNGISAAAQAEVYAANGYWYDVIWLVVELMHTNPDRQPYYRDQLLSLLDQGGLDIITGWIREHMTKPDEDTVAELN